jgi:tRNA threonylcarbamoyladenosine biosynthesis protein TsaB
VTALLAIDTATPRISVALWVQGDVVAAWGSDDDRRHGELLAPAIQTVLATAGLTPADLDAVAVDVGPGLFTGLRVGVATAKALVAALGIRAVPATSLEVLAHGHAGDGPLLATVVDARRKEVFRAIYRTGGDGPVEIEPPAVMTPAALADELAGLGEPVVAVGDGAVRYAEVLGAVDSEAPYPDAAVLARIAADRKGTDAAGIEAFYIRPPDVRIGWAQHEAGAPRG